MRRNRRDSIRKERIIMIASSALVLGALTMTGLYMRGKEMKEQNDGYTLDFTALEENTGEVLEEIGKNEQSKDVIIGGRGADAELDYMPLEEDLSEEVGSGLIQIPGLTAVEEAPADMQEDVSGADVGEKSVETAASPVQEKVLGFTEEQGLVRPVSGEILMPFSMDGSIYFATLDQYKYNPATIFAVEEGADVVACAEGKVVDIFETAELGTGITLELGNGYVATYGQLKDIQIEEGVYVGAGEKLGCVAAPSRYYSVEGTNLYFALEKDGTAVNSETMY